MFGSEGLQGYCQPPNPQDCSAAGSICPEGFVCQARDAEFDGYYLYLDDWTAGTLTDLDYHARSPVAVVSKEKSDLTHTFSGLPYGRHFSARIATFDRSGRISEPSAPSSVEVPNASGEDVPPPTGVRTVVWVTRSPVTGRDGIEVKWKPGAGYSGFVGYRLWRSDSPYGEFCALTGGGVAGLPVCKNAEDLGAAEVTTTWEMFIDDSAEKAVAYYYRVQTS